MTCRWQPTWLVFSVGRPDYIHDVPITLIAGPSNAGPGERQQMLEVAASIFARAGVDHSDVVRVDVPGRGAGEEGDGGARKELEPMIPILQSGSLFGDRQGLELVDAQNLQVAEGKVLEELLESADLQSIEVVLVALGAVPRSLAAMIKKAGDVVPVRKMWERQARDWLRAETKTRGIEIDSGAEEALMQRFGTDTAGIGQALDQLEGSSTRITKQLVLDRFRNRPDEPTFMITDAIAKGDVAGALRRLSDFLVHGHPLVYLAAVESDLKKRSLAAAAPNEEVFRSWTGARAGDRGSSRVWANRGRVRESSLRRAQEALVRADRTIKSQPEEVHRVTLERLTVALCRWYGP
jgi:DNA polymerase III delta subunit